MPTHTRFAAATN